MRPFQLKALLAIAIVLLLGLGCKKSVEGETKSWESNQRKISDLKAQFPGFSKALDEQLQSAKSIWDNAASISAEDQKIAKMAEANRLLSGGWIGQLEDVEGKRRKIRDKIVDVKGLKMDENDRSAVFAASRNAEQNLTEVDERIRMGAMSASAAAPILSSVTNNLESAMKSLEKVESNINAKLKDAQKAEKADADKKAEEEKKNADWKCSYCSKTNPASATECGGCGAQK